MSLPQRKYTIEVERRAWAEWAWHARSSGGYGRIAWGTRLTRSGARRAAERAIRKYERRRTSVSTWNYSPEDGR